MQSLHRIRGILLLFVSLWMSSGLLAESNPTQPPNPSADLIAVWVDGGSAQNLFTILTAGKGKLLPGNPTGVLPVWLSFADARAVFYAFEAVVNPTSNTKPAAVVLPAATSQAVLKSLIDLQIGTYSGQAVTVLPVTQFESGTIRLLYMAPLLSLTQRSSGLYFLTPLDQDLLADLRASGGETAPAERNVKVHLSPDTVTLLEQGGKVFKYTYSSQTQVTLVPVKSDLVLVSDDIRAWISVLQAAPTTTISLYAALQDFPTPRIVNYQDDDLNYHTYYEYSARGPVTVFDDTLDRFEKALR